MTLLLVVQAAAREGSPLVGVIVPLAVFIVSFLVAYLLYRHFSKQK
jgi:uncharacterized membrane protein YoaK (UPF0700 family)